MDERALNLLRPAYGHIPSACQAALLISQEYASAGEEEERFRQWSDLLGRLRVPDANVWFAGSRKDLHQLQAFRHALPEAVNNLVRQRGFSKVGTDIAVPCGAFPGMLDLYYRRLKPSGLDWLVFGHIGECHLHVNVLPRSREEYGRAKSMYLEFARAAVDYGGTVSAEHGIGKLKHDFLRIMVGDEGLREMARVKRVLDPAMILNRGNIFPETYLEG